MDIVNVSLLPGINILSPIFKVSLADIVIATYSQQKEICLQLNPAYRQFQVKEGSPDITLHYRYGLTPQESWDSRLFDVRGQYTIYQRQEGLGILFYTEQGDKPYILLFLNKTFSQGDVYCLGEVDGEQGDVALKKSKESITLNPFFSSLDQLLLINYLAKGRGVVLHSAGVVAGGEGRLFVGVSGAGKSTLIRFWQPTGAKLLSDDRIIIRRKNGALQMYGTPWHGEANIGSPDSAPLKKIFFLDKSSRNSVRPLGRMEAATRLLVCCFPPFHDPEGMTFVMDFLSQITAEIPCYELGFVPEPSVIDFIRGVA